MNVAFKAFRRLNTEGAHIAGIGGRVDPRIMSYIDADGLPGQLVSALAERRALPVKEVFEAFEFFERVRRRVRGRHVADLCCGHGLVGMLFGVFERRVEQVTLLDKVRPQSVDVVLEALTEVAPWLREKVRWQEARVKDAARLLPRGTSIVAVHACGGRTDRCLDAAIALEGALAVMPCCHNREAGGAPRAVREALGVHMASDVSRTFRLEAAGYTVSWSHIPPVITPQNRVLVATLR